MSLETWFRLPSEAWAGSLVGLALGIVSAGAAIFSSAVVPWAAELGAALKGTRDSNDQPINPKTSEGARALRRLAEVRARDPRKGLGRVALGVSIPMTILGVVAGLQIPDSGWLYTVAPVLIAAAVGIGAAFLPGRDERAQADAVLGARPKPPTNSRPG